MAVIHLSREPAMSLQLYLVFVVATAVLIATPGPNVALIVGTSLRHGTRTGLMAVRASMPA